MEDLRECLAPLKVEEKGLIFIPVNNNADIDSAGGSHWALLVYRRETGKFEYYDSYNLSNLSSARAIATKIQPLLDPTRSKVKVKKMTTPQQQNGYVRCYFFLFSIFFILCVFWVVKKKKERTITYPLFPPREGLRDVCLCDQRVPGEEGTRTIIGNPQGPMQPYKCQTEAKTDGRPGS